MGWALWTRRLQIGFISKLSGAWEPSVGYLGRACLLRTIGGALQLERPANCRPANYFGYEPMNFLNFNSGQPLGRDIYPRGDIHEP
jgi:hypothetical protein